MFITFMKLHWLLLLCCLILLVVVYRPPVRTDRGDSAMTLILAQTILREGSIKLDVYKSELDDEGFLTPLHDSLQEKNGHLYNYFPLGSSLLSMPIVATFNAFGIEMFGKAGRRAQSFIAALSCVSLFLIMYLFARRYLRQSVALIVSATSILGSSLSSTLATGLWSHNFAVVFATMTLYFVVAAWEDRKPAPASLIGILLFLAYLCRPTFLLLAPLVFLVLLTMDKRSAFRSILVSTSLGIIFICFSYYEYGQILPDYYMPRRLGNPNYWAAIYGNLLSPARGLLIYTPILVFMAVTHGTFRKALEGRKVLLVFALWPVVHIFAISSYPHWWAGHSYGPRLMVDILPIAYLFLLWYMKQHLSTEARAEKAIRTTILCLVAGISIFMHLYQGLYNRATAKWNASPNIDKHPELLFDWKYPQFLHTDFRQEQRLEEYSVLGGR